MPISRGAWVLVSREGDIGARRPSRMQIPMGLLRLWRKMIR